MLRLSLALRAASGRLRCHYEVLGVPPAATQDELKSAFRERAKQTHPDIAQGGKPHQHSAAFNEMADAYRVLRDPRLRAEYDRERGRGGSASSYGSQWPRGEAENMSEEFRANLYGYGRPGRSTSSAGGAQAGTQYAAAAGFKTERAAMGVVVFSGLAFLLLKRSDAAHDERDPYPSRRPAAVARSIAAKPAGLAPPGVTNELLPAQTAAAMAAPVDASSSSLLGGATPASAAVQDELVRAYWNPFVGVWQRIPEGYEAPAAMDLTAWHKNRADPVEWSRLFAEGKLSQIIPRGGLRERFRPAWDTHAPILLTDPYTGRTIQATGTLPPRNGKPTCDVQF